MRAKVLVLLCFLMGSTAQAAGGGGFGFNYGFGSPYLSQFGLTYMNSSGKFSMDLSMNQLSLSSGIVKISLTKPEINLKWHPFAGSLYLGVGLGQQTLSSEATDLTGKTAKIEVTSMTVTPTIGWMWGAGDGGFYAGMDFGMQSPSGAKTTITADVDESSTAYQDAVTQGDKYGKTSLTVMTFLRIGYLF